MTQKRKRNGTERRDVHREVHRQDVERRHPQRKDVTRREPDRRDVVRRDVTREPANKGKRYPAEILTPDEVRALVKACSNRAPTGIRNRALLVLLYRGGLRVSEALRLQPKDLDRDAGTVTVLVGKGGKRRTIGLEDAFRMARDAVRALRASRVKLLRKLATTRRSA